MTADAGKDVVKMEHCSIAGGIAKITLVGQGPPHKTRDTEINSGESREKPRRYGYRGKFLNRTAMAYAVRSRIDKWDLIKLQSFCKSKDTVNKTKRPPTD